MRNKRFSIQIDKATDCSDTGHLIAYMQYVEDITINEDMLFCKPIKRRSTAKGLFKIVENFVKEKSIKRSYCSGICTAVARVMAGNKERLQVLIKTSAPEAMLTHCVIHRESLAMTELCPKLRK
jgi:hypothetical protein